LDRPLRRGFRQAALVRIKAVADVTLCDLTLARPMNGQAEAGLFKFCRGLRLERVRVEGALSLASCWDGVLTDAAVPDGLALNNCHDVWVRGGRYGSVWGEEGVHDLTLEGPRVVCPAAAGPDRNGIGQGIEGGCERWTLRGVRVEGFPNSPIGLIGRENVVTDVTVAGSRTVAQPGNCYLQGDGLRVVGLRSDRPVVFVNGKGMSLAQVRSPWTNLGWVQGGPASGTALDCGEKVTVRNPEWKVWPPLP
jgi:hypothetical protein